MLHGACGGIIGHWYGSDDVCLSVTPCIVAKQMYSTAKVPELVNRNRLPRNMILQFSTPYTDSKAIHEDSYVGAGQPL